MVMFSSGQREEASGEAGGDGGLSHSAQLLLELKPSGTPLARRQLYQNNQPEPRDAVTFLLSDFLVLLAK